MTNAIELRGLTKRFGSLTAVDAVDLDIPAGQVVALLGPNGAGKSSTTEIILGLSAPTSGTARVFGRPPLQAVARGDVGAMLQAGSLWQGETVGSLLRGLHGMYAHPLPLTEVIERADAASFLRTRTEKLSGGQAQRVRFALALMADPDLLVLDEPTVGLDVEARRRFWATMHEVVGNGRTVLFATHYLAEADEFADRVLVMADGRLVADGTGADIRAVVGGRTITFRADAPHPWETLPGVDGPDGVSVAAGRVTLRCSDSDACLRALVTLPVSDIEVSAPSLDDAFVELTHAARSAA